MRDVILAAISVGFVFFLSLIFRKKSSKRIEEAKHELELAPAGHAVAMSLLKNGDVSMSSEDSDIGVLEKIGYFIGAANDGCKTSGYTATPLQDIDDPNGLA